MKYTDLENLKVCKENDPRLEIQSILEKFTNDLIDPVRGKYFCRKEKKRFKRFGIITESRFFTNEYDKYCPYSCELSYINLKGEKKFINIHLYNFTTDFLFFDSVDEMTLFIETCEK